MLQFEKGKQIIDKAIVIVIIIMMLMSSRQRQRQVKREGNLRKLRDS